MKLKEHLQIFARGVKYAFALEKRHTTLVILDTFLSSITGYIPIYFSAKIIDALAEGAPTETAVLYVVLTVGLVPQYWNSDFAPYTTPAIWPAQPPRILSCICSSVKE